MLADVLGYEKYVEVSTSSRSKAPTSTWQSKLERKSISSLRRSHRRRAKDIHVRQAVDYGANQGVEWAGVTNGAVGASTEFEFKKPIGHALIAEIVFYHRPPKTSETVEFFTSLCKEGSAEMPDGRVLRATSGHKQTHIGSSDALRAMLNQLQVSDRGAFPNVQVDIKSLEVSLRNEVLKRELVDGDDADASASLVKKATGAAARKKKDRKCCSLRLRLLQPRPG